jgi:GTPase SAR1 family protein
VTVCEPSVFGRKPNEMGWGNLIYVLSEIYVHYSHDCSGPTELPRSIPRTHLATYFDYFSKEVISGNTSIVLSIWDTCGSELDLRILPSNVYRVASAYIIVCSYDNRESYDMLKSYEDH